MATYPEVLVRTAAVLVANVAFADIAGQDKDFCGGLKETCLAPRHDVLWNRNQPTCCPPAQLTAGGDVVEWAQ
jgi:hypothetical protein